MTVSSWGVFATGALIGVAAAVIAVWWYITKAKEWEESVGCGALFLFGVGVFATAAAMAGSIG